MKRDHGGKREFHSKKVVDFSSNVNCFGPPKSVCELFKSDLALSITSYPDPNYPRLKRALSEYVKREEEEIFLGNGSAEIFFWVAHLLRPKRVLVISPGFCEYFLAGKSAGAEIIEYFLEEEKGFSLSLKEVAEIARGVDLVFIGNPNNPTGNLFERESLLEIADSLNPQTVLLIDEAFMDFCEQKEEYTLSPFIRENIWVARSLTKFFSLAGLRIGYLLAPSKVVAWLEENTPPWRINRLGELASLAALSEKSFIEEVPKIISREREIFLELLEKVKYLKPFPSVANFILVKITHPRLNSTYLKEYLFKKGFLVRDASTFSGLSNKYIRLAVRKRGENLAIVEALNELNLEGTLGE